MYRLNFSPKPFVLTSLYTLPIAGQTPHRCLPSPTHHTLLRTDSLLDGGQNSTTRVTVLYIQHSMLDSSSHWSFPVAKGQSTQYMCYTMHCYNKKQIYWNKLYINNFPHKVTYTPRLSLLSNILHTSSTTHTSPVIHIQHAAHASPVIHNILLTSHTHTAHTSLVLHATHCTHLIFHTHKAPCTHHTYTTQCAHTTCHTSHISNIGHGRKPVADNTQVAL